MDTTGERWCEPELYRLQGALLYNSLQTTLSKPNLFPSRHPYTPKPASKILGTPLPPAWPQWQQQGKRDEARQVLGDVYRWFTEGFDTLDLQDAKALLEIRESGMTFDDILAQWLRSSNAKAGCRIAL